MKYALYIFAVVSTLLSGSPIKLQFVNNSPNQSIDLYVNEQNEIRNFEFLDSSLPLELPSTFMLGISPLQDNVVVDYPVELLPGSRNIMFVSGRFGDSDNPIKIGTSTIDSIAIDRYHTAINFFHGTNDMPAIDILINGIAIVQRLEFGSFSSYKQMITDAYEIQLNDNITGEKIESFSLDLTGHNEKTFVIYTAGYLNPGIEEPQLSSHMVNINGVSTQLEISETALDETASVQIIHNSPYPVVDIYVDGTEALSDVPYRATTGLIDLPISTTVGIAPADGAVIAEFPFTLVSGGHYVVTASGIVGDTNHPFDLVASTLDTAAVDINHFALKVYHGVTDAPAVDIYANGSLLVDSLDFGNYAGYLQVPVGDYTIDVAAHGSTTPVASFSAPLTGLGGGAGVVFASGFLSPARTDSAFTLILTTPSGYNVELPAAQTALSIGSEELINPKTFALKQNYPNPFNPSTMISFEIFEQASVELIVFDINGRFVRKLLKGGLNSGSYNIEWNGKDNQGMLVSGGVYFYSINVNGQTLIKKMSLIK